MHQFFEGTGDKLLLVADQTKVPARSNVLNRGLLDWGSSQHATHFQIIGCNQSTIANSLLQDPGDPLLRKGSRQGVAGDLWIRRMRHHHEGKVASQGAIGCQIFSP